jgi:hypothetical protein
LIDNLKYGVDSTSPITRRRSSRASQPARTLQSGTEKMRERRPAIIVLDEDEDEDEDGDKDEGDE